MKNQNIVLITAGALLLYFLMKNKKSKENVLITDNQKLLANTNTDNRAFITPEEQVSEEPIVDQHIQRAKNETYSVRYIAGKTFTI